MDQHHEASKYRQTARREVLQKGTGTQNTWTLCQRSILYAEATQQFKAYRTVEYLLVFRFILWIESILREFQAFGSTSAGGPDTKGKQLATIVLQITLFEL